MKQNRKTSFSSLTGAALALLAAATIGAVLAASSPPIEVLQPWARATVPGASTGAAYMTLVTAAEPDELVSASTPVANEVELHTHIMTGGIAEMRPVKVIEVVPGKPTTLAPGGLHLMLMGLRHPLAEGSTFPLTLKFRKAGAITVDVRVAGPGAKSAPN